jgi:hypothetical protein
LITFAGLTDLFVFFMLSLVVLSDAAHESANRCGYAGVNRWPGDGEYEGLVEPVA